LNSSYPCTIFYVSDKDVLNVSLVSSNKVVIGIDLPNLKQDGIIILKDIRNERFVIRLKPNLEAIREKKYIFKLGKNSVDGKTITFNVISKENGSNEPWSVSYSGEPISYDIEKLKTKLSLTIKSELYNEFISLIKLRQDNSGKEISIRLKHENSNSVELYETKEAD
jgi:hypothetical protein